MSTEIKSNIGIGIFLQIRLHRDKSCCLKNTMTYIKTEALK